MRKHTRMGWLIGLAVLVLALSGVGNSPVFSDDPLQKIESNDLQITGHWTSQPAGGASGGSYLFSSGSPDDVLTLAFDGSTLTVIYVAAPQFGILAVEVDGTVLRTIISAAASVEYNQQASFAYLSEGSHTLRLYASEGVVAVDAVIAAPTNETAVSTDGGPTTRGYDTLAALGESDADLGPTMTLYATFADTAASGEYTRKVVNYLVNVMGDWDGDGHDTYGTVHDGIFDYTNVVPDQFTNAENDSASLTLGVEGSPVVGRFDLAYPNDCIGVVSTFPANPTLYLLSYVCDFVSPAVHQQYLGAPLPDQDGYVGGYQFAAGDFDGDGLDSIAVLRDAMIAYTDVDPSAGDAQFDHLQYWGDLASSTGSATLLAGDWDGDGLDSFGVVFDGNFYRRNSDQGDLILQRITPTSRAAAWR